MRKGAVFAFSFSAAVLLSRALFRSSSFWVFLCLFALALLLGAFPGKRQTAAFIVLSAAAIAFAWCFVFSTWVTAPVGYYEGNTREVSAVVVDSAGDYRYGRQIQVRVDGMLCRLYVRTDEEFDPEPGDTLSFTADCSVPSNNDIRYNPASKGYKLYLYCNELPEVYHPEKGSILYFPQRLKLSIG